MSSKNLALAIAPHEHLRFCDSLLGLAGFLRKELVAPRTVDELYALVSRQTDSWPAKPTFEQVVLAVTLLFAIGAVRFTRGADDRLEAIR
jgi:hypothetical protein